LIFFLVPTKALVPAAAAAVARMRVTQRNLRFATQKRKNVTNVTQKRKNMTNVTQKRKNVTNGTQK
jgi:hypothetical protein